MAGLFKTNRVPQTLTNNAFCPQSCAALQQTSRIHLSRAIPAEQSVLAQASQSSSTVSCSSSQASWSSQCRHSRRRRPFQGCPQYQRPTSKTYASQGSPTGSISLFPAGAKQASVKLPAVMLQITADEVLQAGNLDMLSRAVRAGATAVILSEGAPGTPSNTLYDAAVKLKGILTGRAALLVVDRLDIAQAAEADGVLLTDSGMPTVVAKRMLTATGGGLVGRITSSANVGVEAAADGANLILITARDQGPPEAQTLAAARNSQRSGSAIPVVLTATSATDLAERLSATCNGITPTDNGSTALQCDGVALSYQLLTIAAEAMQGSSDGLQELETAIEAITDRLKGRKKETAETSTSSTNAFLDTPGSDTAGGAWARRLRDGAESAMLLSDEKALLKEVMAFLDEVIPDLPELALMRDAARQLDEPFLVVVVGEFNSGKSSVINALLGEKYLAEGILPTTNEISVLRYSNEPDAEKRVEQQADGLYVRYLPSRLLEEMQIVDTPGTNVILERQQRLTEEYVPRADLVLFVMSADRPFSESEVRFLEYIRQWRKKVVFVVNKADMLQSQDEIDQVKSFVADNARRVLRLDDPPVIAVSSRSALKAKQQVATKSKGGKKAIDPAALASVAGWSSSGFDAFERVIYAFLLGGQQMQGTVPQGKGMSSVEGAGEGVRLKLQTPLYVADALMGAAGSKLESDMMGAQSELAAVRAISSQLARFRSDMEKDASAQREALLKVLAGLTSRMDRYVDTTLALSNTTALLSYLTGPSTAASLSQSMAKLEADALGNTCDRLRDAVTEHSTWLAANCDAQRNYYRGFVESRVREAMSQGRELPDIEKALAGLQPSGGSNGSSGGGKMAGQTGLLMTSSASVANNGTSSLATIPQPKVEEFNLKATSMLLEDELKDAVVGTSTTALGAPALGLLVSSWLDNAFEDLLVLGVSGAAAYAAVLNLPLRRAEIKAKASKVAADFVARVQGSMQDQLNGALDDTISQIEALAVPLEAAAAAEVVRLQELEAKRAQLAAQLQTLSQRAANLV